MCVQRLIEILEKRLKLVAYDSDYNKIEDIQIEPNSTVMNIELKNIEKEVPLEVNTVGNLPSGFELISATADVSKVTIRAEDAASLARVQEMFVDVDLSDIKEETEERSNLKIYPKESIRIATDTPIVKVTIKMRKKIIMADKKINIFWLLICLLQFLV